MGLCTFSNKHISGCQCKQEVKATERCCALPKHQLSLSKPLLNTISQLIRNKDSLIPVWQLQPELYLWAEPLLTRRERTEADPNPYVKAPWRGFMEIDNFMGKPGFYHYYQWTIIHKRILPHSIFSFVENFLQQMNGCRQTLLLLVLWMLPMD